MAPLSLFLVAFSTLAVAAPLDFFKLAQWPGPPPLAPTPTPISAPTPTPGLPFPPPIGAPANIYANTNADLRTSHVQDVGLPGAAGSFFGKRTHWAPSRRQSVGGYGGGAAPKIRLQPTGTTIPFPAAASPIGAIPTGVAPSPFPPAAWPTGPVPLSAGPPNAGPTGGVPQLAVGTHEWQKSELKAKKDSLKRAYAMY